MGMLAKGLIGLVLLIHVYIVLLETVWFASRGRKVFGLKAEQVPDYRVNFLNQGAYNAFLVVALALALILPDAAQASAFAWYGLGCVAAAGVVGALSVAPRILLVQTVPAVAGMAALLLS